MRFPAMRACRPEPRANFPSLFSKDGRAQSLNRPLIPREGHGASRSLTARRLFDSFEARQLLAVHFDFLEEHAMRPYPKPRVIVEGAIQHQRLQRFAMACDAYNFIFPALVVTIM